MRTALVDQGFVVNVIVADEGYDPGGGLEAHPIPDGVPVTIGWAYDGTTWTAPPSPPVEEPPVDVTKHRLDQQQAQLDELADYVYMGGI